VQLGNPPAEEGGCVGAERPVGSRTFSGEHPPEDIDIRILGILKGKTAIKLLKSYPGLRKKPY
jgi:hypothetical protein